jgi:hypothetical protein
MLAERSGEPSATTEPIGESRLRWWSSPRISLFAVVAAFALALGICLHQLSLPGVLHGVDEYDDGFYLGTVMRLVNGTVPYKDFVYPQPPGLPLLLAPLGLVGRIIGTRSLMADLRILTAFVTAANAGLVAFLLRRRGVVPALVAGAALALFPMALTADKTLMLEPYLLLFCLLGVTVMFSGDELGGPRRLLLAGLVFGFACTLKLWAVLPVAVAVACCLPRWRRDARPLFGGVVVGFLVPSLPFFVLAPRNFLRDLVAIQFLRHHAPATTSAADRLLYITGIPGLPSIHATHTFAFVLAAGFAGLVVVAFVAPVSRTKFDWFVLATGILSVAAMFISPDFHYHYTYFPAVFVALLFGVCCDRLARFVGSVAPRRLRLRPMIAAFAPLAAVGLVVVASVWGVGQETRFDRLDPGILTVGDQGLAVEHVVPAGACTVTDEPALTITADRFVPDRSSCPDVVDTFSTWIAYDPNTLPPSAGPYDPKLVAAWQSWLSQADYAVLSDSPFRIPFSAELIAWFNQNYKLISTSYGVQVYEFVGKRPS